MANDPNEASQQPQSEAPVSKPHPLEVNLYAIAKAQRGLNMSILFGILSYVGLFVAVAAQGGFEGGGPGLVQGLLSVTAVVTMLVCYVMTIVYFVKLSVALHGKAGCAWALFLFVPCLNYLFVLILSGQATSSLRKHGVRVGLLGANPNEVPKLPG